MMSLYQSRMRTVVQSASKMLAATSRTRNNMNRSIVSWATITEDSPNKNCPLVKEGKHYVLPNENKRLIPPAKGMDYVDSDIMFMNYHEDGFGVCVSSNKDLCDEKNYDLSNRILHYYMPRLPFRTFDHGSVEQMLEFYETEYPHRQHLKDLYGDHTVNFLHNNARIIALQPYLSAERKKAYYVQFSMLFTFDDVAEHLTTLPDQSLLQAYRRNAINVLKGGGKVPPIDFSKVPGFPQEYVEKAALQHALQTDISQRLLQHGGKQVQRAYADSFDYYTTGVDIGRQMVTNLNEGRSDVYTHMGYIQARCPSVGGIVVASASMSEHDATYYSVDDALNNMVDIGMVTESDLSSYHREKSFDKYYGKLVTVNCLDYPVLVEKKSIMKSARESVILHNYIVQHLMNLLSLVPQTHKERYEKLLDNIEIVNDYSLFTGINSVNTRYGWYPIKRQDAFLNKEKYQDDQTIGVVAGIDLSDKRK